NVQHPKETAGGGARTHTALRPLDFESSASANSATPALSRERDDTVSAQKLKYGAICFAALPKLSLTISATPVEVGAAYQPLILRGERSGLSMHTATTESVSLCVRINCGPRVENAKRRFEAVLFLFSSIAAIDSVMPC